MSTGLNQIAANIRAAAEHTKRRALLIIAIEAKKSVDMNFDAHGRPPWTPRKRISKRQRGTNILVISGAMRNISETIDEPNGRVILRANPRATAYSAIQHFGGTINMGPRQLKFRKKKYKDGRKRTVFAGGRHKRISKTVISKAYSINIPARPWLYIPEQDYPRIIGRIKTGIKL